jgi:uncharacterized protein YdgA (DUF945 family)
MAMFSFQSGFGISGAPKFGLKHSSRVIFKGFEKFIIFENILTLNNFDCRQFKNPGQVKKTRKGPDMKKIIFAVGLTIMLAGVGTPLLSGLMTQRIIKQSFDDINQMYVDTGSDISIEIQQYEKNYFSSQIEWKIKLGALKSLYGVEEIVFIDRIDHGFSNVVSKTSLEKNKWFMDFVDNKLDGKNPIAVTTEYKLSGDFKTTIVLDAFSFKEGNTVFEIKPGQIVVVSGKDLNNIFSEMSWAGCTIPGKFSVDNFLANSKMEKNYTYTWEGMSSLSIENIKAVGTKESFEMANLKCDYELNFNKPENVLSIGLGNSIKSITTGQGKIQDIFSKININNIDAIGYEEFMASYSQILNNAIAQIEAAKTHPDTIKKVFEKQMASIGLQLLGAYEKFLKKGFEIQITDVRAQLPQGNIKGDIILSLKKDVTMAKLIPIVIQPSKALDIFYLKSNVRMPYELFGENYMLLSQVYPGMQTGLFLKEGENVIHKAETLDGKLLLNGKEVLLN